MRLSAKWCLVVMAGGALLAISPARSAPPCSTPLPENWLRWGTLVDGWIFNEPPNRPRNVGELEDQMLAQPNPMTGVKLAGTAAPVPPNERNRPVNVAPYNNGSGPITINIPHRLMAEIDKSWLAQQGSIAYPLPTFYAGMFVGPPALAILDSAELEKMRKRRVGEYVINECM